MCLFSKIDKNENHSTLLSTYCTALNTAAALNTKYCYGMSYILIATAIARVSK